MSTPQGLLERPNGYYFQARIPKQYLTHFPSALIRDKLPTENRKEAIALVRKRWAVLHEEFERIDATGTRIKKVPIAEEAEHLISLALYSRLSADDEIRAEGVDDSTFEMLEGFHAESDESERLAISRGILSPLATAIVSEWLQGHGYEVDPESRDFKQFALKFIKAQSAATKQMKQRQLGEHVETPEAPNQLAPRGKL